ncbi:MAG: DUF2478 domain-containing protein [Magnetospirillum sp.]|nr:MAG: DUF2478 domain-containing protein [Magnetospirillum sp.]
MADSESPEDVKAAAIIRPPGSGVIDCLEGFTRILQGQGYLVRGLLQRSPADSPTCDCTMMLIDLDTRMEYRISQDFGPESPCCRVDTSGFAEASHALHRAMAGDTDLIVINKFGKLESQGQGLADEMLAIMSRGIPLITTVEAASLELWRDFTGGRAGEIPPNCGGLMRWWDGVRPRGLPRAFHNTPNHRASPKSDDQGAFQRIEPIPEMS